MLRANGIDIFDGKNNHTTPPSSSNIAKKQKSSIPPPQLILRIIYANRDKFRVLQNEPTNIRLSLLQQYIRALKEVR